MAIPSNPSAATAMTDGSPDLETELRSALEDLANGDFIELTAEELERCIRTGASPWPHASRG